MSDLLETIERALEGGKARIPAELLYLVLVLGVIIFLWDLFDRKRKRASLDTGLSERAEVIAVKGGTELPSRGYRSESLGLSGKPDALVKIDGFIIPVDRKPLSRKVRDRHIVQLLVHMRLVEESEGTRPPYGILLLGKEVREVRIQNTEERQRWLDAIIGEMESILEGVPARPTPAVMKCKSCDVRKMCNYSAYTEPKRNAPDKSIDLE